MGRQHGRPMCRWEDSVLDKLAMMEWTGSDSIQWWTVVNTKWAFWLQKMLEILNRWATVSFWQITAS
jgi:hypothetical protein